MKRILVVDDDKFLSGAISLKLQHEGYETKIATDGIEALEMLKAFFPDLIILDLVMPNKDGFATLKEIKADAMWKNIPVIIASNLGQKEDIDWGKKLGAVDYVIKADLSLKDLTEKIKRIIP